METTINDDQVKYLACRIRSDLTEAKVDLLRHPKSSIELRIVDSIRLGMQLYKQLDQERKP